MAGPEITIKISPDGSKVEMDAEGFVGGACQDTIKRLSAALGPTVEEKKKPEFYKTEHGGTKITGR